MISKPYRVLRERERKSDLEDSIAVGLDIAGLVARFTDMGEADVERWMGWHDKWEKMSESTRDSYLVLLALRGGQ